MSLKVTSECEQRMVGDHLGVLHSECKPMVAKEMIKGKVLPFFSLSLILEAINSLKDIKLISVP